MLLLFDGRRSPGGKQSAARRDLHADDTHLLFNRKRQELFGEAVNVSVRGVESHEDGVKGMAIDGVDEGFGTIVPSNAEEADDFLLLHFEQRFHSAALGEHRVDVFR